MTLRFTHNCQKREYELKEHVYSYISIYMRTCLTSIRHRFPKVKNTNADERHNAHSGLAVKPFQPELESCDRQINRYPHTRARASTKPEKNDAHQRWLYARKINTVPDCIKDLTSRHWVKVRRLRCESNHKMEEKEWGRKQLGRGENSWQGTGQRIPCNSGPSGC